MSVSLIFGATLIPVVNAAEQKYFFTLHCYIPKGNFAMEKLGEILVEELAKIGIEFIPFFTDWGTMSEYHLEAGRTGKTFEEGGMDIVFTGTSYHKYDADGIRKYFYSGHGQYGVHEAFQFFRFYNPELDTLMDEGIRETDDERRKEIYQRCSEIIYEEQVVSPYLIWDHSYCMSDKFKGYSDLRTYSLEYIQDWWIEGKTAEDDVTVNIAFPYPLQTYNPMFAHETGSIAYVKNPVFDQLVGRDDRFFPCPEIAESWEFLEEGKTVVFHLRDDVYFHDGVQLTSKDVLWTYEMTMNPDVGAYDYTWMDPIESLEAPDAYTFILHLKYPTPTVITQIATRVIIMPSHMFEGLKPTELFTAPFDPPIGSGPYKFVKWMEGDYVELEAYDDHIDGRPFIDLLFLKVIPDPAVAMSALEKGEIMFSRTTASPAEVEAFKGKPGFEVVTYGGVNSQWVAYNNQHPILQNKWVRWAISYMIPREHLCEDVSKGQMTATSQVYVPDVGGGVLGYNPDLPEIPYSLEKAWECMEKAGYKREYLEPQKTPLSDMMLYAVIGIVVGAVVGSGATYALKRKK